MPGSSATMLWQHALHWHRHSKACKSLHELSAAIHVLYVCLYVQGMAMDPSQKYERCHSAVRERMAINPKLSFHMFQGGCNPSWSFLKFECKPIPTHRGCCVGMGTGSFM
eukprot:3042278-Amphidinium_carterae.1